MTITNRTIGTVFFFLVLLSMWTPGEDMPGWLGLFRYALFLLVSGSIVVVAYLNGALRVPLGGEAALTAAFLFYVAVSALWSTQSADSYIKGVLILSALLTALSISNLKGLDETLRIIFAATAVFVVLSVLVAVLIPSIGVEDNWEHGGKWRGLAGQKNGLAGIAALTLVAGVALPLRRRATPGAQFRALAGRGLVVAASALAIVMAGSRGGQLVSLVGIFSILIAYAPKLLQRLGLLCVLVFSVPIINLAVSTFWIDADKIGIVGITIDTNSRTMIWEYGLRQMQGRELFGYGVNGFWTAERMAAFKDVYGWVLDNFHNGYITLFVENGILGFSLFMLGLVLVYMLMLVAIGALRDGVLALAFAWMNMFTLSNLVENEAGRSTSISIIIFTVITFSLRPYVTGLLRAKGNPKPFVDHTATMGPRLTPLKPARR